ncbi:copper resistance protein CopC [Methylomonas sp. LL1]|nr:copper resistance protein CopC [Methylomonas sp. LL1]
MNIMTLKTLFAAISLLGISQISHAEGVLIKSEPKDNAEIAAFDGTVKLWFSGNVSERSPSIVVIDGQGKRVDNGDTRLVLGERHRLTATTQSLQPGPHAVRYRVVTEDGLTLRNLGNEALASEG